MKKGKTTKINFNVVCALFALIPMITSILVLAIYSINSLDSELETNTFAKLQTNAIQVREYFE